MPLHKADALVEPFRGGRGGRGGPRGGRGGFQNINGGGLNGIPKASAATTTATTTEGWASQVEAASVVAEAGTDDGAWGGEAQVEDTSKGEDFSAAGGWGDAPAAKELEKAAKTGGKGWEEEIKKDVPSKTDVPPAKPKMTWAQIAK